MKAFILSVFISVFLLGNVAVAAQHAHLNRDQRDMMSHANPMPNLMRVVQKHGDMLGLSEGQVLALADWRMNNHQRIQAKVRQLHDLEKAMYHASLRGKSKAEIMAMAARAMQLRTEIIAGKTACRDYMRSVLNDEQYARLVAMYDRMYGMR